jgi:Icc-related predicted phosphoesterase
MDITVISDTHTMHRKLDLGSGEVLVHCGDFQGSKPLLEDFLEWFSEQDYKHKIMIAGNHDWEIAKLGYEKMYKKAKEYNITYLENSSVRVEGLLFYGAPWSNEYGGWDFMKRDDALFYEWQKIPNSTNVLITHGPAKGTGDMVPLSYASGNNVGSYYLERRIIELLEFDNLKLHLYGHIHWATGVYEKDEYLSVNAALSYEYYEKKRGVLKKPLFLEI